MWLAADTVICPMPEPANRRVSRSSRATAPTDTLLSVLIFIWDSAFLLYYNQSVVRSEKHTAYILTQTKKKSKAL
jgi:hypothetical protein